MNTLCEDLVLKLILVMLDVQENGKSFIRQWEIRACPSKHSCMRGCRCMELFLRYHPDTWIETYVYCAIL